jgi:hypothetical protein
MRCLTSDKWFMLEACLRHDAACRPICPARSGRQGRAIRVMPAACIQHDERLNVATAMLFASSLRADPALGDDG